MNWRGFDGAFGFGAFADDCSAQGRTFGGDGSAILARIAAVNGAVNAVISLRDPGCADGARRGWRMMRRRGLAAWPANGGEGSLRHQGVAHHLWLAAVSPISCPSKDDLLAARMRAAGAIFIGKTNTPEWGHGSHSFNPVHGVTRNPYDLTAHGGRIFGRGCGGAGGADAACGGWLGHDGVACAIRRRFAMSMAFGPSWGLVPGDAEGDTHLATLATEGPMARTVEDVARLLTVQAGVNPEVPFGRDGQDFASALARAICAASGLPGWATGAAPMR